MVKHLAGNKHLSFTYHYSQEKEKIRKAEEEKKAEEDRLEKERLDKEEAEKAAQNPQPEE